METKIIGPSKVSFGTKPIIGDIVATTGLSKYKSNLSKGIYEAFSELSNNGINDDIVMSIGIKKGAKKLSTDTIEIGYYPDSINKTMKSSSNLSPKVLEKKSVKNIKNIILDTYEKLKKSNKQRDGVVGYPQKGKNKITDKHKSIINKLVNEFGFDDWTCA